MKFQTTVHLAGNNTGIIVPDEIVTELGSGKRPAVVVTVNDFTYRSTVARMGGVFMIPVSAEIRGKTGIVGGETVEVELELDTAPRVVEVPDDFRAALDAEPAASAFFESISYSNKRRHVLNIEGAKTDETRQRRIAKSVETLREGRV